jgi:hypothetical protein
VAYRRRRLDEPRFSMSAASSPLEDGLSFGIFIGAPTRNGPGVGSPSVPNRRQRDLDKGTTNAPMLHLGCGAARCTALACPARGPAGAMIAPSAGVMPRMERRPCGS